MPVRRYNISKPEKYIVHGTSGGTEKTKWHQVGTLTEFLNEDGSVKSRLIEIPAIGFSANAYPIEPRDRQDKRDREEAGDAMAERPAADSKGIEYPDEKINIDDIPF